MSIEKIIHQTWKTEEIPEKFAAWVDSVRRENPDFEYRLWTDEDNETLIAEQYPWFLETYHAYEHPVERADAARYFIVYTHGGVYLDLDMECLRPLDALIQGEAVHLSIEAGPLIEQQVISNALLAAPKGHPFFHKLIHFLPQARKRDVTFQDIFNNTGPNLMARLWSTHRHRYAFRILGIDQVCPVKVLPQNRALPVQDLESIRRLKALTLLHHNTETWNVGWPAPTQIPDGWRLILDHDLPGHDLAFVGGSLNPDSNPVALIHAADTVEGAVAVNFNGMAKAPPGAEKARLSHSDTSPDTRFGEWHREVTRSWVAVREDLDVGFPNSSASVPAVHVETREPVTLISYGDKRFQGARDHCLKTGTNVGGFVSVLSRSPKDLDGDLIRRNLPIFAHRRGAGLWLWKPFIVLRALEALAPDSWLFYADAGTEFLRSVDPVVQEARELDTDLLFLGEGFRESQYTKRDAFVLLDCDNDSSATSPQRFAGHLLIRKTDRMVAFWTEVLEAAQDCRILTDQENQMGLPNHPDFIAHRHDQSILSLLSKTHGIPSPPTNTWTALGVAPDLGQILNHTRLPHAPRSSSP